MNTGKILRIAAFLIIIILISYFYFLEFNKNWSSLQDFKFIIRAHYLFLSLLLFLIGYFLETYIWQVCINKHIGRPLLNFAQSIAVVNSSGLLKYLPGRIWTYTAQVLWLKKYGISKSVILYVNLICILGSVIVSLYFGLIYIWWYTNLLSATVTAFLFVVLVLANGAYIIWHTQILNKFIIVAGKFLKKEIRPLKNSRSLFVYIQFIYFCGWLFLGLSAYFLATGVGLHIQYSELFALLASTSLSWIVGYFAVVAPGGLGVREGMMLVMLREIVNPQVALIYPILSRIMYLVAEALLGLVAFILGLKYKIFH